MPAEVFLILPLIGGYIFVSRFYPTSFKAAREEGHKLYFRSAFYGAVFFVAGSLVAVILQSSEINLLIPEDFWKAIFPWLETNISGAPLSQLAVPSALSIVVSLVSLGVFNSLYSLPFEFSRQLKVNQVFKEITADGNDFEEILFKAQVNTKLVQITLDSRKVYVGFCTSLFDPSSPRKWVGLLPVLSGYLDQEKFELTFTVDYRDVISKVQVGDPSVSHLDVDDFTIALPVDHIQTARIFDPEAYNIFIGPEVPSNSTEKFADQPSK